MSVKFIKMEGCGNDYVLVNCFEETLVDPAGFARTVSRRHFGVGSDGLILLLPSSGADVRMRIFNPDGSEAEMCGNGIRLVAKLAYEAGITRKNSITVETLAGTKTVDVLCESGKVSRVRVNMGKPILQRSEIPMLGGRSPVVDEPIEVGEESFHITALSMGNPHCVIFTDDLSAVPLEQWGPLIENCSLFPNRTNVEFVNVLSDRELEVRVWERGAGATLACGTGACASLVAGVLNHLCERSATCHLPGGDLEIEWSPTDELFVTGPAREVFRGEITQEGD